MNGNEENVRLHVAMTTVELCTDSGRVKCFLQLIPQAVFEEWKRVFYAREIAVVVAVNSNINGEENEEMEKF